MKFKVFILFFFCSITLFSQTNISGCVLDEKVHEPIPYVVVYTNSHSVLTDENGHYNLSVETSDSIYFQHLAYNFYAVSSNSLLPNNTVYLIPHTVELTDVVISPVDAQVLLTKAGQNLNKKLKKEDSRLYLFHVEESNSLGKGRELYALIDIAFNRTNKITRSYIWNSNLLYLDKNQDSKQDDFYGKIGFPIRIELFPTRQILGGRTFDKYIYSVHEVDSEHFILNLSPRHPNEKNYWYSQCTINKRDTTLEEFVSQSLSNVEDLTQQHIKNVNFTLTNQFYRAKIVQDEKTGDYHFKQIEHIGSIKVKTVDSNINVNFRSTSSVLDGYTVIQGMGKKKIKLSDYELFETDFPNTPGFWKQYVK